MGSQAFYARESYLERSIRDLEADARGRQGKVDIDWDELDDLAPEWDRAESGIDDLLSLNTAYWEPGLGPRAPRNPVSHEAGPGRGRSGLLERGDTEDNLLLLDEDEISNPSSPQLDTLMHQAMTAVNTILDNLEREKGEQDLKNASQLAKWSAVRVDVRAGSLLGPWPRAGMQSAGRGASHDHRAQYARVQRAMRFALRPAACFGVLCSGHEVQ